MSTTIELNTHWNPTTVTSFCGPAELGSGPDRMCIQIGDHIRFSRTDVKRLQTMLVNWLADGELE